MKLIFEKMEGSEAFIVAEGERTRMNLKEAKKKTAV
jgi:hypothetical protein